VSLSYSTAESPEALGRRLQAVLDGLASRKSIKQAIMAAQTMDRSFRWAGATGHYPDGTRLRPDAPFFIASIDTLLNAVVAMTLSEAGRLDIDATISAHLPPAPTRGLHRLNGVDYSERITIRHLLGHTSGLADWLEDRPKGGRSLVDRILSDGDVALSIEDVATIVREQLRPHFPPPDLSAPRQRARYSDTNYILLCAVIEAVTGQPLTAVMLHSGVCVPRQYARFCGIVYGAKTRKFFAKLVRLQYASMFDCRNNRARIYHVNQRALYAAIGEADSRLRKPVTLNHAIQRLMVLDAIVEDPDLVWLGSSDEKAMHLLALTRIAQADLPHVGVGEGDSRTVRYFPDRLPIGVHLAGRGVVVYVVTDPWLDEFRVFLERHAALLRALPAWTLRIVLPPQFPDIAQHSKQVVWNQLLTPLRTETLDELRWYFEQVRAHPTPSLGNDLDERFYNARDAFSAHRFKALYRVWKQDGEVALAEAGSHTISEAVKAGAGRVETLELGHRYGHLSPLVTIA
jgi:hypothetical protein